MSYKKININDIPNEFVIGSLTPYQIELIQLKFNIVNRFYELRSELKKDKKPKNTWNDVCFIISEEIGLHPRNVRQIILKNYKICRT